MEEEKGISIGDFFRTVFLYKWVALIVALAITVAGTLTLYFGYNKITAEYQRTFTVSFPGSEEINPVYPDNSPFVYSEIISPSNLAAVKASDERFDYIDIDRMYEDGGITITRSTEEVVTDQIDINYTLYVKCKYFYSKSDASDFIKALAEIPVTYITKLAIDQDLYIRDYENTEYYEDKAAMLTNQVDYLKSALKELSALTKGNLQNSCASLQSTLGRFEGTLNTTIGEMRDNLYVHSEEVGQSYRLQIATLEEQLESKKREADILFGRIESGDPSIDLPETSERVEELSKEIPELESRISVYKKYIAEYNGGKALNVNAEFKTKLAELNTEIKALTDSYEQLLGQYYKTSSVVAYDGGLTTGNDLGLALCVGASFVVGVIVAIVVAYVLGSKKKSKLQKTQNLKTLNEADAQ